MSQLTGSRAEKHEQRLWKRLEVIVPGNGRLVVYRYLAKHLAHAKNNKLILYNMCQQYSQSTIPY